MLLSRGGCRDDYKLQFDFSKSTMRMRAEMSGRGGWKEEEEPRFLSASRLGSPSASAGYQLAIRALIAFECNVAENFI